MDTRVRRGLEIGSDHYALYCKIRLPKRYIKSKRKIDDDVKLLEEASIQLLYQQRLDKQLKGRTGDIDLDWEKLKIAVYNAAVES